MMHCQKCDGHTTVIDSRRLKGTGDIRRRRLCMKCGERFSTYERVQAGEADPETEDDLSKARDVYLIVEILSRLVQLRKNQHHEKPTAEIQQGALDATAGTVIKGGG